MPRRQNLEHKDKPTTTERPCSIVVVSTSHNLNNKNCSTQKIFSTVMFFFEECMHLVTHVKYYDADQIT